jgi:chromosome partitioning protein
MLKIAVINQKGGVGKTTTTANLGAALTLKGKRVLLLDMDPQANLTLHVDRRPDLEAKTMTNVMVDGAALREVIVATAMPGLDIAPADTSLAGIEQVLANRIGRETILREAFAALAAEAPGYDFALLDCPPSLGVLSANALVSADRVLVPVQTEYFALQGMAKLFEVVELVKRRLNPSLAMAAILPCMVDLRTNLTAEVLAEIERHFGNDMARSFIRANVKLAEAPSFGRTIFEHAPDSNGAQDYLDLAAELLGETPARHAPTDDASAVASVAARTDAAAQAEG